MKSNKMVKKNSQCKINKKSKNLAENSSQKFY